MDSAHAPDGPPAPPVSALPLYHRIASEIERAVTSGALRPGDRLPSVRQLSQQHAVSMTTALQAYRCLENRGLVLAKPKSGYFVTARPPAMPEPQVDLSIEAASFVSMDQVLHDFLLMVDDPLAAPSFNAAPARALLPEAKLQSLLAGVNRRHPEYASKYQMAGSTALRQEIARRAVGSGVHLRPDEIVITNGGMEAVYLALKSVASPGDTIVLESPTYFHLLQSIESLGMRALEIPSHPRHGISLEALDFATQQPGAVKACVLMPNFPNPMGSLMPIGHKRRLVRMMAERKITLIESDIYGELYFGDQRPPVLKSFDTEGDVVLCSAFTKTVAPGYRIGWVAPGRHFLKTQTLKVRTSVACPMLQQEVLAQFIRDGGYDHHLRKLRAALKTQAHQMADAVARYFPPGCRLSLPQGGLMLWIELPRHVDSREVFMLARLEHIGVAPGAAFSCSRRFDHFIRLQYGDPWSPRIDAALRKLGQIVTQLAQGGPAAGGKGTRHDSSTDRDARAPVPSI
ncbi:PLP-dependent aminotransferase family protein [Caldimonas brevitalea]|uniref:Transcriptional regulator, GntR family domain / Aspartate aminotransferase n=1 Tax=Caldimonas brevitalea TaxID=413882 RepID=A0A0G3BZT0_9BURK|nr:PLP-dependent aminotransferase family protein [Caldimonas brevitalea]AKJ32045.1 transcriptional regulator, GntR family domain / Aspartate aminotransferase [Caldimonas brevitalea]